MGLSRSNAALLRCDLPILIGQRVVEDFFERPVDISIRTNFGIEVSLEVLLFHIIDRGPKG